LRDRWFPVPAWDLRIIVVLPALVVASWLWAI
jgi:hypothetical protein